MAVQYAFGKIVTQGLDLNVDAADPTSYPGTGNTWTSVVNRSITGSLVSCSYSSDFKGGIVFTSPSASVQFPGTVANYGTGSFTIEMAFRPSQIQGIHYLISDNSGSFPNWGVYLSGSGGSGKLFSFYNISSTVSCSVSSSTTFATGSNYFVDIPFRPNVGSLAIYTNSNFDTTAVGNGTGSLTTTASLFIGNITASSGNTFSGSLYNVKIYRSFLNIITNYNTIISRLSLPAPIPVTPLLDTYPNAAAAYSLRKLSTVYTGNAIRVRRSNDNAEQNIGFTPLGDLDTTSLLSFCGSSNGFVTTWYDQSGNGNNATQTTPANQPQIVTSGVLETRAGVGVTQPAVRFNNADTMSLSFTPITNVKSVFIVLRRRIAIANWIFWIGGNDYHPNQELNATWLSPLYASTSVRNGVNRLNGVNTDLTITPQADGLKTLSLINQNTSSISGIGLGVGGADRTWDGHQSELIIYTTDQTSTRSGIENNVNRYYQIY
jgi:hypothetical protein